MPRKPQTGEEPKEDHVRHELNAIFRDSIFPISAFIFGLFVFLAVLHGTFLEEPVRATMTQLAAASAVVCGVIWFLARRGKIETRYAYIAGFTLLSIALGNAAAQMWLTQDIDQSSNFALIFVAIGLFFLSRWRLAVAYLITFALWAVLARAIVDHEGELLHFAVMNVEAALIGVLALELRLRVYRRLVRMRAEANIRERELTQALAKARLYATVERENKAKTEFLANMSHELRTPLNAILGFSEAMQKELFGPLGHRRYVEYTHDIHNAGAHLLSLVNDILDLSRIELEGMSLTTQKIDFARVCNNCLAIVRGRAERGGVRLTFEGEPPFPEIETDERRLKQVLINLLSNAVKFTPAGGTVTLDLGAGMNGGAVIRVGDTGIGMSREELDNALRPFWQADAGLDRAFEGTGLGLALVSELLRMMGGHLNLESEPGVGTIATVTLPPKVPTAVRAVA